MSYLQNGENMLTWFYNGPTNTKVSVTYTGFTVGGVDISNTYIGLGTNSKISVSNNRTINYTVLQGGSLINIGSLFELNLPIFSSGSVINTDYKILPPSEHNGLLIQILRSTIISFNYNVNCIFIMVGGGGGGGCGGVNNGNAGGGGGAGEVITGSITGFVPTGGRYLSITIGDGGAGGNTTTISGTAGGSTSIIYFDSQSTQLGSISATGGGYGGGGKTGTINMTGSSTGGTGSYSAGVPNPGTAIDRTISNTSIFNTMSSFNNNGIRGQDNNSDKGAGGGGGGAGSAAGYTNGNWPSTGGNGYTVTYGSTSITLGGGGGGGAFLGGNGGAGGSGGGGNGGNNDIGGSIGTANTGGGGGGGSNASGSGGNGGSGTVLLYIVPAGVTL